MKRTRLLSLMGLFVALGVVASYASAIPLFGAKLFPTQGALNVIAGALLGPISGGVVALAIAVIRIILGTGSLLAIPGSLFGAVLAGLLYRMVRGRSYAWVLALLGEVVGTGLIGAIVAYPMAVLLMRSAKAAAAGITFYIIPFAISSFAGAILGGLVLRLLERFVKPPR